MRTTLLSFSHALSVRLVTAVIILPLTAMLDPGAHAQRGATIPPTVVQRRPLPAVSPTTAKTTADIVRQATPAVVTVVALDSGGKVISQGSGFFIRSDGTVLTAWHVLKGASAARVVLSNGATFDSVRFLAGDQIIDVALLKVAARDVPTLGLRETAPALGSKVVAIGSPLGLTGSVSEGVLSSLRDVEGRQMVQVTASISPGSSGGPLLDDTGRAFAISTATAEGGQQLNFGVPVKYASQLLQQPYTERGVNEVFAPPPPPSLPAANGPTAQTIFRRYSTSMLAAGLGAVFPGFFEKDMTGQNLTRVFDFGENPLRPGDWGGVWRREDETGQVEIAVQIPWLFDDSDHMDVRFVSSAEQPVAQAVLSNLMLKAESSKVTADDHLELKFPMEFNRASKCATTTTLVFRLSTGAQLENLIEAICPHRASK